MPAKTSWKKLLQKVEDLFGEARVNLHAITVLLVKIFDDREFRHDIGIDDDYLVSDWLDKYITETNLTFIELRAVLIEFPDENQWKETTIRDLYERTLKKTEETTEAPVVNRTAWKKKAQESIEELEEVELENARLKKRETNNCERLSVYEREIRDLKASFEREIRNLKDLYEQKIHTLKEENALLHGRIEELEKLHKPELVMT